MLVLSLWPLPDPPPLSTGWDKTDHVAAYFVLGCLGFASWALRSARVLVGLLAYGAAIELLQSLVVYRVGDWRDLVANASGVLLAAAVFGWREARRGKRGSAQRYRAG